MTDTKRQDSKPAFPRTIQHGDRLTEYCEGMTLRQYAAIHLRVPDSGLDWLDEMIRKSQRFELAKAAVEGILGKSRFAEEYTLNEIVRKANQLADAMLKQMEGGE